MVKWLSSDIYIFEHIFFSEGSNPWGFFSFSYSFSGQFELVSAVTNSGGSRRGSGEFGTDYFILIGIFKKLKDHLQIDPLPKFI